MTDRRRNSIWTFLWNTNSNNKNVLNEGRAMLPLLPLDKNERVHMFPYHDGNQKYAVVAARNVGTFFCAVCSVIWSRMVVMVKNSKKPFRVRNIIIIIIFMSYVVSCYGATELDTLYTIAAETHTYTLKNKHARTHARTTTRPVVRKQRIRRSILFDFCLLVKV